MPKMQDSGVGVQADFESVESASPGRNYQSQLQISKGSGTVLVNSYKDYPKEE